MQKLLFKTYLQAIQKSVGSKIFQNLFVKDKNEKFDVLKNGKLSCAYFVSTILTIFGFINKFHATIKNIEKEFQNGRWKKVRKNNIKPGDIIIWEEIEFSDGEKHKHIGFYIGKDKAISNSHKKRVPVKHHYTFNGKRKIEAIYRYIKW